MKIRSHEELQVFQLAFQASMKIFELSKNFPKEEKYSLTDQIRRSSRSVCANLAEAFRKRKYPKYFVSKLMDCEGEAAETQVWLLYALKCGYIEANVKEELNDKYNQILGKLVVMCQYPEKWTY